MNIVSSVQRLIIYADPGLKLDYAGLTIETLKWVSELECHFATENNKIVRTNFIKRNLDFYKRLSSII